MKKLIALGLVAGVIGFAMNACEPEDTGEPDPGMAYVLVFHGNYFEESNVYEMAVNGTLVTPAPIAYRASDTKYRAVTAGMQTLAIIKGVDTVARIQADLAKDSYYTLYLHGNGLSTKGRLHLNELDFPDKSRTMIYLGNLASASSKALVQSWYIPIGGGWNPVNDMLTQPEFGGSSQPAYGYQEFVQYFVKDYTDASMNRQLAVTPFRIVKNGADTVVYNQMFEMRKSKAGNTVSYIMLDKGNPVDFEIVILEHSELK